MMPPATIITRKVGEWELRRMFNDPTFQIDIKRRTAQTVETYCELAPPSAGQAEGAMSHIHDWYEYLENADTTRFLATVHFYKNHDGTIGASGKIDPQVLAVGDVLLVDPWPMGSCHDEPMKTPEYTEGPTAWTNFKNAMAHVLTVPHAELQRRIEAEREASALNPNRRGPKPKRKPVSRASKPARS